MLHVTIEDHVVPQLLTSALEAYAIGNPNGRKKEDMLETFGLLWGYVIPERSNKKPRVVATIATVETSALRKQGSVTPDLSSLRMKMEFVERYWPHLEVVGTFHSHPYPNLKELRDCKGWEASTPQNVGSNDCDVTFWPYVHEELFGEIPYLAHLIVAVTAISKKGWALPKKLDQSGFELTMGTNKIWITSYGSEMDSADGSCIMMADRPVLDIPSLTNRVS